MREAKKEGRLIEQMIEGCELFERFKPRWVRLFARHRGGDAREARRDVMRAFLSAIRTYGT